MFSLGLAQGKPVSLGVRQKLRIRNKMILHYILNNLLGIEGYTLLLIQVSILIAIFIRVKIDCSKINEGYKKHIIPIIFLPVIFTLLWLIIWPGTLRLFLMGKKLEDTNARKVAIRKHNKKQA